MVRRNTGTGRRDRVPVVDPAVLVPSEPVSGLAVRTPFRLGGRRLEPLDVERGSGWYRCEGTVYGWVRAGSGRIEHGPDDAGRAALTAGAFLGVPAGLPHRYVPGDEPLELLVVVDADREADPSSRRARPTTRPAGPAGPMRNWTGRGDGGGWDGGGSGRSGRARSGGREPQPGPGDAVPRRGRTGDAGTGGGRRGRGLTPPRRERLLRVRRQRPERDRVRPGRPRGRTHRDRGGLPRPAGAGPPGHQPDRGGPYGDHPALRRRALGGERRGAGMIRPFPPRGSCRSFAGGTGPFCGPIRPLSSFPRLRAA
jgi:hypothetical protein